MTLHLDARQRAMLKEMGVHVWLPGTAFAVQETSPKATVAPAPAPATAPIAPPAAVRSPPVQAPVAAARVAPVVAMPATALPPVDAETLGWPALVARVATCQACGLHAGRTHCVLREDTPPVQADWLVVLDPPEEDEERSRAPITADAAALLDNMLKAAGVARAGAGALGAYVTTVAKCRAPHATMATGHDLQQCLVHLRAEMALVRPRLLVLMGRFAQQLVQMEGSAAHGLPLDKLRGTVHQFEGLPAIVTYHPKILLRSSPNKAKAWADLCLALDTLASTSAP
jgi:DNA polymerase